MKLKLELNIDEVKNAMPKSYIGDVNKEVAWTKGAKYAHEAATKRLMTIVEKAVEMATFVNMNTSFCSEHLKHDVPFCKTNQCEVKFKAREFLSTLAVAGVIKKESK